MDTSVSSTHLNIIFPHTSSGQTKTVLSGAAVDSLIDTLHSDCFRIAVGEDGINVLFGREMIESCLANDLDFPAVFAPNELQGQGMFKHLDVHFSAVIVLLDWLSTERKEFGIQLKRSPEAQKPLKLIALEALFENYDEASLSAEGILLGHIFTLQQQ
jgi:hypothetical protein